MKEAPSIEEAFLVSETLHREGMENEVLVAQATIPLFS
tara:strand:+ start:1348 stop:1461 length:114 start_codon:yes stop_codon:yes gene_type:complete